ncbi:MAG TPA: EAL domain-containing protein [Thioalkalivibrio sp.]|nr:EAL domain-containing protein [Thioalkalivibrio sp.]
MKWLYHYPLSLTLPLLLLAGTLILAGLYMVTLVNGQQQWIRANAEREIAHETSRLQRMGQHLIERDNRARLQEEISAFGPDIRVSLALVLDDDDRILAALDRVDRGQTLADSLDTDLHAWLRAPLSRLLADARAAGAAHVDYLPETNTLLATAPLEMTGTTTRLGPPPLGSVVLAWDLSHPYALARQAALRTGLMLLPLLAVTYLGLWWLLYQVLVRRLATLSRTAEHIAKGAADLRADLAGRDEVGRLAQAFNAMTEALAAEHAQVEDSERRLSLAQNYSNIGSWEWDLTSGKVIWTDNTYRLFGVEPVGSEITYARFMEAVCPEDRATVEAAARNLLDHGQPYEVEYRVATPADGPRWLMGRGDVLRDAAGNPLRMYGIVQDISQMKAAEAALYREKELAQVTLASIGDGVITTDTDGRVRFLNPVAEYLTGWSTPQAEGKPLTEVFNILNELTRQPAINPVERCLREGRIVGLANHTVLLRTDGREFAIEDSAAPIRDSVGTVMGVVLVFHDVTKAREMANRLSWQASHDALTGLHNRMAFEERLRQLALFPEGTGETERHTLLYIDLDQFKVVNDIAGHVAGDELLKQIGGLMQEQVRDTDMLARLGGDEFGVILTHCDIRHAQRVADAIHHTFDDFKFAWDERVFRIGASIGVLEFRPGEQSLTDLLSAADMACYAAKNAGRRRTHIYEAEDEGLQRHRHEMDWATRINDAVEDDRLVLYAQTIERLGNGYMPPGLAFEVLVRMRDPSGELIAPDVFLPAAERFDLISIVDRWIITRAFSMVADCTRREGAPTIAHCAINLSGGTLGDETLLPFIKTQLSLHDLPGEMFCFEITETAAISNFQAALRFIRELRAMGCRFALDDFGSGLSSFSYLKNLPVDYLKIDGTFVRGIATDPVNRTLVGNINDVGHLLGKHTIAEYAEDTATVAALRQLGVDYAQGYGISRPKPLEQLLVGYRETETQTE